jgi:hypothetical protein
MLCQVHRAAPRRTQRTTPRRAAELASSWWWFGRRITTSSAEQHHPVTRGNPRSHAPLLQCHCQRQRHAISPPSRCHTYSYAHTIPAALPRADEIYKSNLQVGKLRRASTRSPMKMKV